MPKHIQPDRDRAALLRRPAPTDAPTADGGSEAHPMLTLQRQIGNAQIARMLAQREGMPEEEEDPEKLMQAKHDPALAQREDAPAPEEEDEKLMQAKHDPALAQREDAPAPEEEDEKLMQAKHDPALAQREGAPEEDDDPEKLMQAKPEVGLEGGPVSDELAGRIESKRGSGSPLDDGTRSTMEGALGASFEGVRVHSDAESAQLNQSISAKAFTTGSDIFLGQGASAGDHDLMAHELTHVVQQRDMSASGPLTVGPAGDSYEQQADAAAAAVASGASAATAQRKNDEQS
jgi:hypothetical protein